MRYDRSWSVFVLCVIGRLIAWPSVLYAQEVTDLLNEAHEQYEQSLEEIERDAITRLDELIDQYSDQGNLKKVLELRTQKTKLLEDRNWPESVFFRSMRAKIRSSRVRAKRELADAYEDAIARLTKERRYDDAVAIQKELEQLTEIQEEFDFRSEEPEQKKPENDAEDPKPEDKSPAKSPVKEKAARPTPQKRAASKASDSGLAAALATEAEKTALSDPLATSEQKKEALSNIVGNLYKQSPPGAWTSQQVDDFIEFFAAASMKADKNSCGLPNIAPDAITGIWAVTTSGQGVSGSADAVQRFAVGRPGMQWLISSPTHDEFISRAAHLHAKGYWPAVNEQLSADDLKLWLKSIGCNDAKSFRSVMSTLGNAGVRLTALDSIIAELGQ